MADNITGTDFSGSSVTLATKELGDGAHAGKIMSTNASGDAAQVATEETLAQLLIAIARLMDNVGVLSPDTAGRLRVVVDTGSSISTITTVTGVTTVTTVSAVTNIANLGGMSMSQALVALQIGNESDLRRNIVQS